MASSSEIQPKTIGQISILLSQPLSPEETKEILHNLTDRQAHELLQGECLTNDQIKILFEPTPREMVWVDDIKGAGGIQSSNDILHARRTVKTQIAHAKVINRTVDDIMKRMEKGWTPEDDIFLETVRTPELFGALWTEMRMKSLDDGIEDRDQEITDLLKKLQIREHQYSKAKAENKKLHGELLALGLRFEKLQAQSNPSPNLDPIIKRYKDQIENLEMEVAVVRQAHNKSLGEIEAYKKILEELEKRRGELLRTAEYRDEQEATIIQLKKDLEEQSSIAKTLYKLIVPPDGPLPPGMRLMTEQDFQKEKRERARRGNGRK